MNLKTERQLRQEIDQVWSMLRSEREAFALYREKLAKLDISDIDMMKGRGNSLEFGGIKTQ